MLKKPFVNGKAPIPAGSAGSKGSSTPIKVNPIYQFPPVVKVPATKQQSLDAINRRLKG